MKKERLDILLVNRNLFETREKAKSEIMAGNIFIDNIRYDKPGVKVKEDSKIELRGKSLKYVSRGGLKLEKAIDKFNLDLNEKICMDVGSSTGGFTDCMLQNGASKIYAIDVGYGQLHYKLREDKRVVVLERTNVRNIDDKIILDLINFISIDVSFISLKLVLPVLKQFIDKNTDIIILIKPQFEAGKEMVGKKGVIRDPKVHKIVLENILDFLAREKFELLNLDFSPVTGAQGNIEFLGHIRYTENKFNISIEDIISSAHENFKKTSS